MKRKLVSPYRIRTIVHSNGSKWAGESPDPIGILYEALKWWRLDRETGWVRIETDLKKCIRSCPGRDPSTWEYGGPMYVDSRMTRFGGNFIEVSHPFCIDTNDPKVISRLTRLFEENKEVTRCESLDFIDNVKYPQYLAELKRQGLK